MLNRLFGLTPLYSVVLPDYLEIDKMESTSCCRLPKTNRKFWIAKIRRNKERDKEEQRRLADMGWHCITVWECELSPKKKEHILESLAFTLNHIFTFFWINFRKSSIDSALAGFISLFDESDAS